jgi:RND family efflux transporter MFP subunit
MLAIETNRPTKNDETSIVDECSTAEPIIEQRKHRPRIVLIALVVSSLALLSAGAVAITVLRQNSRSVPRDLVSATTPLVPVRLFVVGSRASSSRSETFTGVVRARHEIQLAFRVAGKIQTRRVDVGQSVQRGDVLFELDTEDYSLQVESTKATLDVAKSAVLRADAEENRLYELLRARAVSSSEYEEALADRDSARGRQRSAEKQLELAKNQVEYCQLIAEADGIVMSIDAEAGQVVAVGSRVGSLAQSGEMEAVIDIPENRLEELTHSKIEVGFWSLPNLSIPAKLREVSPIADAMTRTFRVRFAMTNIPKDVKLGMTTAVSLQRNDPGEFELPPSAIFSQNNQPAVWRLCEDGASIELRPVTVSQYGDDFIRIGRGLEAGDTIVSAGVQKLDAGMKVRAWETQK